MLDKVRKIAMTLAALGALGLGGAAIAGAADNGTSSGSASTTADSSRPAQARQPREPLSADVAAKVKAAALAKVPGATVVRTEAGGPYDSAYHAHIETSDGTRRVVLVNASFAATSVQDERAGGPRGGPGRGGAGETALTGDTKAKVEAAVLARYPGATIVRTETNDDSTAPYESHVTTAAGTNLEVLVSSGFEIVEAREHPARP